MILPILSFNFFSHWLALILSGGLWLAYSKMARWRIVWLGGLFFLVMWVNNLVSYGDRGWSFDVEKMNIANPGYISILDRYAKTDLGVPYSLRETVYGQWMLGFLWADSILKLASFNFWLKVMGFFGLGLMIIAKKTMWEWWWLVTVLAAAGMGIMVDSLTAVFLAWPVIFTWGWRGLGSLINYKQAWIFGCLIVIDWLNR